MGRAKNSKKIKYAKHSCSRKRRYGNNMPIDPNLMKKYPVTSENNEHAVRGEIKPPEKLGIHGTQVALDQDVCNDDGICISVCLDSSSLKL
jgi:NAD-dependent dihydropyrimidine dehydrogenase PreA subunit